MNEFAYQSGKLHWAGADLDAVASQFGTPLYVYSEAILLDRLNRLKSAFAKSPQKASICYSVKANSNLSILRIFAEQGCGADIVSIGELVRCQKAGIPANRIVFSGVGKTEEEIEAAIQAGILFISIESDGELEKISSISSRLGKEARISVRVNPDVDPKTHPYISTGLKSNKFGIRHQDVIDLYVRASKLPGVKPTGLGYHIGSQITELSAFKEAAQVGLKLVDELRARGIHLEHIDVGGGLGISYKKAGSDAPDPAAYAAAIIDAVSPAGMEIIFDPGRSMVGNAGVLLTRILYVKKSEKDFLICDAAMNDLLRPSLYDAYHEVLSVMEGRGNSMADLVGPICESGDFIAKDRLLPGLLPGDLAAICSAGAYGFVMSSNYNSRPRPAEVLISKTGELRLVRKRETLEDLVRGEL